MTLLELTLDRLPYYTHNFLAIFSIGLWIAIKGLSLLAWFIANYKSAQTLNRRNKVAPKSMPWVSVIRPLSGLDFNLYQNLESSFLQDYPNFELLFCVNSDLDPSVQIVRELIEKYPKIKARLVIDAKKYGDNPKINNLMKAYDTARYDILWVCDSNVQLNPGCLSRSLVAMEDVGVGLVHHLPVGIQANSLGGMLDTMFLNVCHSKQYMVINYLYLTCCVIGKSCLYRKSVLEKFGGMLAASSFLSEDYYIANEIRNLGYKHVMVEDLVYQPVGNMSLVAFFQRRSRWIRLRKHMSLLSILLEPLSDCIINGLIACYGFNFLLKIHPYYFFILHLVLWFVIDIEIFQTLQGSPVTDIINYTLVWCLRESTAFPLLLYSAFGSTLSWRGKKYHISTNTKVVSCEPIKLSANTTLETWLQIKMIDLELQHHSLFKYTIVKYPIRIAFSFTLILINILNKVYRDDYKELLSTSSHKNTKNSNNYLNLEKTPSSPRICPTSVTFN